MDVLFVSVHVKPEAVTAFVEATRENAENSRREPDNARFEFYQQQDDPTRFILIEAYRSAQGPAQHRATAHYLKWLDRVTPMMAEPRTRVLYRNHVPGDEDL
jgi:(4S)-4-hydroxy-5-phosphonooxypentane-2,3-dione isomerase